MSAPPPQPSWWRPWYQVRAAHAVLLIGVPLVFFHRAAFTSEAFLSRDMLRTYAPLLSFWAARIKAAAWPEWYPYDALGQSYVGMVVSHPFHPSNLLALIAPVAQALKLTTLACFPVAAVGAYRLARRLGLSAPSAFLSGVAYSLSGYLVTITNNLSYLLAAATLPWALAATEMAINRPTPLSCLRAAALLALILMSGDPQTFCVALALALLWPFLQASTRDQLARAVAAAIALALLAIAIGAPQWAPAWSTREESRFSHQTAEQAQAWSLHPLRVVEMALGPIFAGSDRDRETPVIARRLLSEDRPSLWAQSVYLGAPVVVLATTGLWHARRRRKAWLIAIAGGLLFCLALGKHLFLYRLCFHLLPAWKSFRYPEKLLPFFVLAVALGAGAGWELAGREERARRTAFLTAASAALLAVASAVMVSSKWATFALRPLLGTSGIAASASARVLSSAASASWRVAIVAGLFGATLLWIRTPRLRVALCLLLLAGDLYWAHGPLYELTDPAILEQRPPLATRLASADTRGASLGGARVYRIPGSYRVPASTKGDAGTIAGLSILNSLDPDSGALFGLESANVALPAANWRVVQLFDDERDFLLNQAPRFGTGYMVLSREIPPADVVALGTPLMDLPEWGLTLLASRRALPRAYLTSARCVQGEKDALAALRAPDFDPLTRSVVECDAAEAAQLTGAEGRLQVLVYEPDHVQLSVETSQTALLVLNDAFASGWEARIDGSAARLLPANMAVRGLFVPAGKHMIVMQYRTPGFHLGLFLAALGVSAVVAAQLWRVAGSRRSGAALRETSATDGGAACILEDPQGPQNGRA